MRTEEEFVLGPKLIYSWIVTLHLRHNAKKIRTFVRVESSRDPENLGSNGCI